MATLVKEDCDLYLWGKKLQERVGVPLRLLLNQNRRTMVSVRRERARTRVSLHQMFLQAPEEVVAALVPFIQGRHKTLAPVVNQFIDTKYRELDYSKNLDPDELALQGHVHDLEAIYQRLNAEYFNGDIDLRVTWYGNRQHRGRQRVTLGLYEHTLKLVKIHRILDRTEVPEYVVEATVHHEICHFLAPGFVNENGRNCIHHAAFKQREKEYKNFHEAEAWIKDNRNLLFR